MILLAEKFKNDMKAAVAETLKSPKVPWTVEELIAIYEVLPKANIHVFTVLLLLSYAYSRSTCELKSRILSFFFEDLYPNVLKKVNSDLFDRN